MAGDSQRERAAPDEGPASTGEEDRSRLQRVMAHWKVVAGILGIPITVLTLITAWFGVQDRIWPPAPQHTSTSQLSQSHQASPTPQAALEIASFDAQTVLQDTEITYGSSDNPPEDTTQEPTAVVSIGLRNRGDAPVFLTRAVFTFRAYEPLGTCVQVGDAIFTSQVIDVEVPLPPDAAPTETDLPISHGVKPNEVDRLDFRFGPMRSTAWTSGSEQTTIRPSSSQQPSASTSSCTRTTRMSPRSLARHDCSSPQWQHVSPSPA